MLVMICDELKVKKHRSIYLDFVHSTVTASSVFETWLAPGLIPVLVLRIFISAQRVFFVSSSTLLR